MDAVERKVFLEGVQYYAAQSFSPGALSRLTSTMRRNIASEMLVAQLHAVVYGVKGEKQYVGHRTYTDTPNFPRWLPKWLKRRWTRSVIEDHQIPVRPWITWPDMPPLPAEYGKPVYIFTDHETDPEGP